MCSCPGHISSDYEKWGKFRFSKDQLKRYIFDVDHENKSEEEVEELDFTPDPFDSLLVPEIDRLAEEAMDRYFPPGFILILYHGARVPDPITLCLDFAVAHCIFMVSEW